MKYLRLSVLFTLFYFFVTNAIGQNTPMPPPPPPAEPTAENAKIIDEIIVLSKYESFYNNYAYRTIEKAAIAKNWTKDEVIKRKKKVDFNSFKGTIYNAFAFYTKEELELLKTLYTSLNKRRNNNMVMFNSMIQNNMELSVIGLIKD